MRAQLVGRKTITVTQNANRRTQTARGPAIGFAMRKALSILIVMVPAVSLVADRGEVK